MRASVSWDQFADLLSSPHYQAAEQRVLLFPYAGAYAWHISHHDFLRHPPPRHIYLPAEAPVATAF